MPPKRATVPASKEHPVATVKPAPVLCATQPQQIMFEVKGSKSKHPVPREFTYAMLQNLTKTLATPAKHNMNAQHIV
jgi:hypothetical protein